MPESSQKSSTPAHYRCTCPKCQKVLKIKTDWSGKRGVCPHCQSTVRFPAYVPPAAGSPTTQQLLKLTSEEDAESLDDAQVDRLALLLSQATCRDFHMATELLNGRALSARQWRRTLNAADLREAMRLRLEARVTAAVPEDDAGDPAALQSSTEAAPNAWKILARLLYFQRHGVCNACQTNLTGLTCIYLTFEGFLAAREISENRAEHWHTLLHNHLGL